MSNRAWRTSQAESPPRRAGGYSPDSDERYEHPAGAALTRSYHEVSMRALECQWSPPMNTCYPRGVTKLGYSIEGGIFDRGGSGPPERSSTGQNSTVKASDPEVVGAVFGPDVSGSILITDHGRRSTSRFKSNRSHHSLRARENVSLPVPAADGPTARLSVRNEKVVGDVSRHILSDAQLGYASGRGISAMSVVDRSSGGGYGGSEDERGGGGGAPLRHSVSAHSVKVGGWGWPGGGGSAPSGGCMCVCVSQEYAATNGDAPASAAAGRPPSLCSPPSYHQHHHDAYYERPDRLESCSARGGADAWERESERERERPREFASAVMAEHRGFTRRPVTRNSNLLSAVLCLVKELDYASLEVAEMAVSSASPRRGPSVGSLDELTFCLAVTIAFNSFSNVVWTSSRTGRDPAARLRPRPPHRAHATVLITIIK
ncbi:hypothetical protein EVAR_58185_1 [Eumeta japonica]|uniref:Uncharacterized protein n=1 Tax=Eumeta variegata TaxID=151549 RepID=A0A4C1YVN7_EUMVA|nr:hypothetical protein EVAR_58185_1 [Eumeta japonica]